MDEKDKKLYGLSFGVPVKFPLGNKYCWMPDICRFEVFEEAFFNHVCSKRVFWKGELLQLKKYKMHVYFSSLLVYSRQPHHHPRPLLSLTLR